MDPMVIEAIATGAKLLPSLIQAVASLIQAGHSPEDAEEIVRKDITSRLAEYERMRAEDEAALAAKHAPPPPSSPYPEEE